MEKPCLSDHGDYQEGCATCWKWKFDPRYEKFRSPEVVRAPLVKNPGYHIKTSTCSSCPSNTVKWIATFNDREIGRGESPTKAEAIAEAQDEIEDHRKFSS